MTLDELRELNPAVRNTDMVTIGQSLVVQREQPYLQVQIAQTLTYTETVAFTTEKVQDKTKYLGYEKVKTAGKNGVRQVTAEVVTVDGVEQSRTVLSAKVTQEPVTQVVVVGAKTYSCRHHRGGRQGHRPLHLAGAGVHQHLFPLRLPLGQAARRH